MLVVLVVVALAAGMLLPRLGDVGAARVDREAQRLAEAVTLLRERAILGGAPAALVVDVANGRWTAGDVDAAALPAAIRFRDVRVPGAAGTVVRLDLDPAGDAVDARFDLVDEGGHAATVLVPATGGPATVARR